MNEPSIIPVNRRSFLRRSGGILGGVALAGALDPARYAHGAASSEELKIALIGCGGRGSGAASQALNTNGLGPVKLVAMADVFEDRLQSALGNLSKQHKDHVKVDKESQFIGFDAYKKAIAMADVVILTTPPGFRPMMFEEAIKQGKHVFMEKPVATDAAGVNRVLAAAKLASAPLIMYGSFLNAVLEFLIIAFVVFLLIRQVSRFLPKEAEPASTRACPYCLSSIPLPATRCAHCTAEVPPIAS